EVAATATLNINGKPVVNEQGAPIREWPYIQQVPVGSVTVMVKAPGYEPLVETVTVVEGNVPAQLKNELKKKSSGGN
ncbi:MAG TPA: PEGA domain-containing protein, partial [Archangium sp.]